MVEPLRAPIQQTRRETIIPRRGKKQPAIPWHSWALLFVTLGAGFVIFYYTHGDVVKPWLKWGVTVSWVAVTLAFGLWDFAFQKTKPGETDATPVDRWTIPHTGAGVVFGVWYSPVWLVVVFTVFWELFEWKVKGFGDKEIFKNRVIDVGVAVFGWWLVVSVIMGTASTGAHFPLLTGR